MYDECYRAFSVTFLWPENRQEHFKISWKNRANSEAF